MPKGIKKLGFKS